MRALMCWPKFYKIGREDADLNPYMSKAVQPDTVAADTQFRELIETYLLLGIRISFITPTPNLFDQTFTANTAWAVGKFMVMANLRPEWRREEVPVIARWLTNNRFNVIWLPEEIQTSFGGDGEKKLFFEGQADVTTTRDCHLYSYGVRNDIEFVAELKKILSIEKEIVPIRLSSPKFFHGDVAIRYSGPITNKLIWCPAAYDNESNNFIEGLSCEKLDVDESVAIQVTENGRKNFLLNGVYINGVHISPWDKRFGKFPQRVKSFIEKDGDAVEVINFSEFGLSGAGPRCCTLFLD